MKIALSLGLCLLSCFLAAAQIHKDTLTEREYLLLYELDTQYLQYCQTINADILDTILKSPFIKKEVLNQKKSRPQIRIFDLTQQFYSARECWKISYAVVDYRTYIYDKLPIDLNSGIYYDLVVVSYRQINHNRVEIDIFYNLNNCDNLHSNPNRLVQFSFELDNKQKPFIISSLYSEIDD